jgi:aspartate/methionine/tyrosine aminotransferase
MTHPALGQVVENLIQYSTSGVAQFMQRAAATALERGEGFVQHQIARARQGRAIVCDRLASTSRCRFAWPQGAFYVFFAVEGENDARRLALRLIDEAGIGLAPGTAFGAAWPGYLRLCFVRDAEQLKTAMQRLVTNLTARS